jgi:hypothetical protein
VKQKEFGVKGPEVTIIGQGTWYIDRGDRKSAVAALRRGIGERSRAGARWRRPVVRAALSHQKPHRNPVNKPARMRMILSEKR